VYFAQHERRRARSLWDRRLAGSLVPVHMKPGRLYLYFKRCSQTETSLSHVYPSMSAVHFDCRDFSTRSLSPTPASRIARF
jgi:hypothetical protein